MAHIVCKPRVAAGARRPTPRGVMNGGAVTANAQYMRTAECDRRDATAPMVTVVRWVYDRDAAPDLVKVGPRKPTMAMLLQGLADKYNK